MAEGKLVKVQKASDGVGRRPVTTFSSSDVLEELCYLYHYPFHYARALPYFRVARLLKKARQQRARHYLNLTQITAAPHTKGGDLYKQLVAQFGEEANG